MKETPGFFMRRLLLQKAIWMSAVMGCGPSSHLCHPLPFQKQLCFSRNEQAFWTHVLLNRGPWRPIQSGKLCTQLQNCVWIMGLGTPSW